MSNNACKYWDDHSSSEYFRSLEVDITTFNKIESKVLPPERDKMLLAVDYLRSLHASWDDCWGHAPSVLSLDAARRFVELIPFQCKFPDTVAPNGEGGICFYWKGLLENMIVTVEGAQLHLSHTYGHNSDSDIFQDGILFDQTMMPAFLVREIPKRRATV